ncbi:MAG: hypothetical protein JNK18_00300 [Cyclobacteriaceae bacterium]|nr:hypothetical protein [Cyclobacteriaceae bacterium]
MRGFFLTLVLVTGILSAYAQSEAYQYLETIGNEFQEISQNSMSYTSAASHGKSARKVEKRRTELINSIKAAETRIRRMKPFAGDASLRDSVVAYLVIDRIVMTEDYGKILNMEEIAEQSYDAMEAYLLAKEKAEEKLEAAYDRVGEQQKLFANRNNIKIVEGTSKLGKKLEKSGRVISYHNKVYLLFFKSYKNEAYLMDALNKKDISAMEQTKNTLLMSAEQDLEKLGPIPAFNGDNTLKTACQQMLAFYKMEASQKVPEMVNFLLKQENFEKMNKAIQAKRPSDRSLTDIDNYNNAVKEFNAAVDKVNAMHNDLNKKRSTLLEQWNNASENFLDKHVPKHNG